MSLPGRQGPRSDSFGTSGGDRSALHEGGPTSTLHLHIETLVVRGVSLADGAGQALGTALELELGRLLAAQGDAGLSTLAHLPSHVPRWRAPALRDAHGDAASLGRAIARSLHAGLRGTPAAAGETP